MGDIPVTLTDILEIRDGPLAEEEIVALSVKSVASLQAKPRDASLNGKAFGPDNLCLHANGSVQINLMPYEAVHSDFLPPEIEEGTKAGDSSSIFVFCLGAVLSYGVHYPTAASAMDVSADSLSSISPQLLSLLNVMTVRDMGTRPTMPKLAQMGRQKVTDMQINAQNVIIDLYKLVMGDEQFSEDENAPTADESSFVDSLKEDSPKVAYKHLDVINSPEPTNDANAVDPWVSFETQTIKEVGERGGGRGVFEGKKENFDRDGGGDGEGVGGDKFGRNGEKKLEARRDAAGGVRPGADLAQATRTLDPFADERDGGGASAGRTGHHDNDNPFLTDSNKSSPIKRPDRARDRLATQASVDKNHKFLGESGSVPIVSTTNDGDSYRQRTRDAHHRLDSNSSMPDMLEGDEEDVGIGGTKAKNPGKTRQQPPTTDDLLGRAKKPRDPFRSFYDIADPDSPSNDRRPMSRVLASSSSSSSSSLDSAALYDHPIEIAAPQKRPVDVDVVVQDNYERRSALPRTVGADHDDDSVHLDDIDVDRGVSATRPSTSVEQQQHKHHHQQQQQQQQQQHHQQPLPREKPTPAKRSVLPAVHEDQSISISSIDNEEEYSLAEAKVSEDRRSSSKQRPVPADSNVHNGNAALDEKDQFIVRRNSLTSDRISGRRPSSKRPAQREGPMKVTAGPEFLHKSRLPSIRLKAPPTRKKTNTLLHNVEDTGVQVHLLNGQKIEVSCKTDAVAGDVFTLVVTHTNLTEHVFFGLTIVKDGEHYFLEPHQRLRKFAPPGWDKQRGAVGRNLFTLFLRLRYYPHSLEFIRSDFTRHEMYLQLRRDLIDERMLTSRDAAFNLGALALQAELGDRPNTEASCYFLPSHYLPEKHLRTVVGGDDKARGLLAECHSQYAGQSKMEAEVEFLKLCQAQKEYGIHFHRVYKSKPATNLGNTPFGDPDTGTAMWIGILPRGIIIFEERGGARVPISQHPWHMTQTLEFDKKRFAIVAGKTGEPGKKHVFYTDDYKKSCYFVKFAESQHRFMMKMRHWTLTLETNAKNKEVVSGSADFGVPVDRQQAPNTSSGRSFSKSSHDSGVQSREASPQEQQNGTPSKIHLDKGFLKVERSPPAKPTLKLDNAGVIGWNEPSHDASGVFPGSPANDISDSMIKRLNDASDCEEFEIYLQKDPKYGLGLTLVDGDLNGVKGVYIKSVTPNGPGEVMGNLKIGDRIVAVNGVSLQGKNRHDTVGMVKESGDDVTMTVLRLKSLDSLTNSSESEPTPARPLTAPSVNANRHDGARGRPPLPSSSAAAVATGRLTGTPTKYKHKSVSDYGSPGDVLPALSAVDIMDKVVVRRSSSGERPSAYHRKSQSNDANDLQKGKSDSHLHNTTNGTSGSRRSSVASSGSINSGVYEPPQVGYPLDVSSNIYGGLNDSEDSDFDGATDGHNRNNARRMQQQQRESRTSGSFDEVLPPGSHYDEVAMQHQHQADNDSDPRERRSRNNTSNIDWTEDIDYEDRTGNDDDYMSSVLHQGEWDSFEVTLRKNDKGGLGLQIAGGKHNATSRIYIKALISTPALTCDEIRPGDRLVSVNGLLTDDRSHKEVVEMLKSASSPVTLGLARHRLPAEDENSDAENLDNMDTITVSLEKPSSGSLGLSLAKITSGPGIYVRSISKDSAAALCGKLLIGDRLWEVNGESVADASPLEVIDKLKNAQGFVNLVVKRFVQREL